MILGLDIATTTGWCMGDGSDLPVLGSITMPSTGEEIGPFLEFYERWLVAKVDVLKAAAEGNKTKPIVIFEAPFLPPPRMDPRTKKWSQPTSITTTRKLQSLSGLTEMAAYKAKVPIFEEHLQTVKLGLAGHGKADKLAMMAAAKRHGVDPKNFDEADAFGVWLVGGVRHYAKKHAARWVA